MGTGNTFKQPSRVINVNLVLKKIIADRRRTNNIAVIIREPFNKNN